MPPTSYILPIDSLYIYLTYYPRIFFLWFMKIKGEPAHSMVDFITNSYFFLVEELILNKSASSVIILWKIRRFGIEGAGARHLHLNTKLYIFLT